MEEYQYMIGDWVEKLNINPLTGTRFSKGYVRLTSVLPESNTCEYKPIPLTDETAFIIVHNYMKQYGLCTPKQIISRWAPSADNNNTAGYISIVCEISHMDPDMPLHFDNEAEMVYLVQAMAYVETGCLIDGDSIRKGYAMAMAWERPSLTPPKGEDL